MTGDFAYLNGSWTLTRALGPVYSSLLVPITLEWKTSDIDDSQKAWILEMSGPSGPPAYYEVTPTGQHPVDPTSGNPYTFYSYSGSLAGANSGARSVANGPC
jgi:hypothetical protein